MLHRGENIVSLINIKIMLASNTRGYYLINGKDLEVVVTFIELNESFVNDKCC